MDLASLQLLLTPAGAAALAAAHDLGPDDDAFLSALKRLEKRFPRELAKAALETVLLRQKARAKFARADVMFFTREALEQSTGEAVARHRAVRFAGFGVVGDFCCGLGGDTLALAERTRVVAIDADPLRLALAQANAAACGVTDRVKFHRGDLLTMSLPAVDAAFVDPDRRAGGRRHVAIRDYEPNLDRLRQRLPAGLPLGVKVAPAVAWGELRLFDAEAEFISLGGELKECVLWFGPLRTTRRRATVLPAGATLAAEDAAAPTVGPIGAILYDPDPAVTRAGLVANLAGDLGARQLDTELAFLTADELRPTPFATAYRVEEWLPFHLKRLRERLRQLGVGRVTVLKRGSPVEVGDFTRQLKLAGPEHRTVVLTRAAGEPVAVIAARTG